MVARIMTGAVAGLVGGLVMDLVWYRRYRSGGGEQPFTDWDFSASTSSFEEASPPGKVGKKAADAVGLDLPDEAAGATTNVVHWLTAAGYGAAHGLLQHRRGLVTGGLLTGAGAFASSYATLGGLGVYEPIWEYDRDTLLEDLTAHLAFGLGTAVAYEAMTRGRDGQA